MGLVGEFSGGNATAGCEGHAKTESIAQRSRRSQRGDWIGRRIFWREDRGLSARVRRKRKSIAQRSRRSQRGERIGRQIFWR